MNEEFALFRFLRSIKDAVEKEGNNYLKNHDLTFPQSGLLLTLYRHAEYTASYKEVEKRSKSAQSTVATMVSRLESKGFVETFYNKEDKRIKLIRLTDKGHSIIEKINNTMKRTEENVMSSLTDVEKTLFIELLNKISSNIFVEPN